MNRQDLVVTRIIDAPVEKVWEYWTEPQKIVQWWGPQYYLSPSAKIDLKIGGKYTFAMKAPDDQGGLESYSSGEYKIIVPKEILEFSIYISNKDGLKLEPSKIGLTADFPEELNVSVSFFTKGNMTELIITEYDWPLGQPYVYSYAGMHQSLDKLSCLLAM